MSNDVQSHDTVVERAAAGDRRTSGRHAAATLGAVTARLIGGSQVDLVNFSNRGVLFECDSRLLIGARASVRITSPEHNLVVTGRVVRSRVKGLVNGALRYDAALALDHEFALTPALAALMARAGATAGGDFESAIDQPVEEYLAESEASLAEAVRAREASLASAAPAPPADAVEAVEAAAPEDDPVAFEADGDIAFEPAIEFSLEPAVDFAFDGEPAFVETAPEAAADVPVTNAGVSMFDPTPQLPDQDAGTSMFDSTPAAYAAAPAEPVLDAVAAAEPVMDTDAAEVAFEPAIECDVEDAVMFEASFDPPGDEAVEPPPLPFAAAAAASPAADGIVAAGVNALEPASMHALHEAVEAAGASSGDPADATVETVAEPAAETIGEPSAATGADPTPAPSEDEDRVLLQFAATVPQDLAELRRIAADNQW